MKTKSPKGQMPKHILEFIEDESEFSGIDKSTLAKLLTCDKCGKWVDDIDHLAPYHLEMNWCNKCGFAKD